MKIATDLEAGEWIVEFHIVRRIRVAAMDEIQAELEAANLLLPNDRASADEVRIVAGVYEDNRPYHPPAKEEGGQKWYGIDKNWWAANEKD